MSVIYQAQTRIISPLSYSVLYTIAKDHKSFSNKHQQLRLPRTALSNIKAAKNCLTDKTEKFLEVQAILQNLFYSVSS